MALFTPMILNPEDLTVAAHSFLPDAVFKAYDIRGVVPDQLDAPFALALGLALAELAREQDIAALVIGYDGRHSSPDLAAALQDGLNQGGIDTIDIGCVPTPLVYFGAHVQQTGSGVAITGSHNPSQYNGFKMMMGGKTLHGDDIQALKKTMSNLQPTDGLAPGKRRTLDLRDAYIERIASDVMLKRPMKIAVDCGNGVGGIVAADLYKTLGCQVDTLYCDVDGNFPNHHPDPADPRNLADLIAHVQQSDCEIGLAFDGDADRLGVVTKSGQIIWPDRQLILYARDILDRLPGSQIIFDVKCSRHVAKAVKHAGGRPVMAQTGHSMIKAKLAQTGAPLAGEMSGHIFFKERWYGFDDGLYAGARLLEILSAHDDPSEILEDLPQDISTPEIKMEMPEGLSHALIARLRDEAEFPHAASITTIDGVRAEYSDGFGLARASNTTPVIVLRFEGDTPQALEQIQDEFRRAFKTLDPDLTLPF